MKDPVCDVCAAPGEGTHVSAASFRSAVMKGFDPFHRRLVGGLHSNNSCPFWRDGIVAQSATDWNLCSVCYASAWSRLPAGTSKPPPPRKGIFVGHSERVNGVALSADGRIAASTGWDRTVRTWDTSTWTSLNVFEGHTGFVEAVALSPDSKLAVSAGAGDCCISVTVLTWPQSLQVFTAKS